MKLYQMYYGINFEFEKKEMKNNNISILENLI